jgi:hypothetical protein
MWEIAVNYGLGQHVWNLPFLTVVQNVKKVVQVSLSPYTALAGRLLVHRFAFPDTSFARGINKWQLVFASQLAYAIAIALTKLAIMVLYLRIFPHNTLRRLIYATSVFTVLFCIATVLTTIFQCTPVHAIWDFDLPEFTCIPYVDFLYASAAINVVTDILVCTMPLPYFWRLQMPKKQKLVVCFLFFLGGL